MFHRLNPVKIAKLQMSVENSTKKKLVERYVQDTASDVKLWTLLGTWLLRSFATAIFPICCIIVLPFPCCFLCCDYVLQRRDPFDFIFCYLVVISNMPVALVFLFPLLSTIFYVLNVFGIINDDIRSIETLIPLIGLALFGERLVLERFVMAPDYLEGTIFETKSNYKYDIIPYRSKKLKFALINEEQASLGDIINVSKILNNKERYDEYYDSQSDEILNPIAVILCFCLCREGLEAYFSYFCGPLMNYIKYPSKFSRALISFIYASIPFVERLIIDEEKSRSNSCGGYCIFTIIVGFIYNFLIMQHVLWIICHKFFGLLYQYRYIMKLLTMLINLGRVSNLAYLIPDHEKSNNENNNDNDNDSDNNKHNMLQTYIRMNDLTTDDSDSMQDVELKINDVESQKSSNDNDNKDDNNNDDNSCNVYNYNYNDDKLVLFLFDNNNSYVWFENWCSIHDEVTEIVESFELILLSYFFATFGSMLAVIYAFATVDANSDSGYYNILPMTFLSLILLILLFRILKYGWDYRNIEQSQIECLRSQQTLILKVIFDEWNMNDNDNDNSNSMNINYNRLNNIAMLLVSIETEIKSRNVSPKIMGMTICQVIARLFIFSLIFAIPAICMLLY